MKADSLWLDVRGSKRAEVTVALRRCPNCGRVKITSRPCGFDHLAAVMEFNAWRDVHATTQDRP